MFMKKAGPLVAGSALAIALATVVTPTAGADTPRTTVDKEVTFACQGSEATVTGLTPNSFTVSAPETVAPGEAFTVSLQPAVMRSGGRAIARLTLDYALPTNATVLGFDLAGGAQGLGGTAPSAIRVGDNKQTNAAGPNIRIWGGASARYGSSTSTSTISASGGTTVAANTDFRLPQLDIVLRAPATVGAEVVVGLPGANVTPTGSNGTAQSTDLAWTRATQCTSDAAAAALATVTVGDLPAVLLPSTTTLGSNLDKVGPGQATQFTAKVTAENGAATMTQGKVQFLDADSGSILGEVNPSTNGEAKLDHTFDPVAPGQPDQTIRVEAKYLGVHNDIAVSTSGPVTVTNTAGPTVFHELGFNLRARLGVETETEVPVTIEATIVRPAGSGNPDNAMVQLYRGSTPVGEPVAMPAGNQMTWTDTIARQPRTTTEQYRVEFVAPVIVGYQQWNAAAGQPIAVIVTGTDPSLDPPLTGNPGSLDMTSILGSLGNMFGTGS